MNKKPVITKKLRGELEDINAVQRKRARRRLERHNKKRKARMAEA